MRCRLYKPLLYCSDNQNAAKRLHLNRRSEVLNSFARDTRLVLGKCGSPPSTLRSNKYTVATRPAGPLPELEGTLVMPDVETHESHGGGCTSAENNLIKSLALKLGVLGVTAL